MNATFCWPMRPLRTALGIAALAAMALPLPLLAQTNGTSVLLNTVVPNATGVQFGFWENQNYQYQTFATFGHRPTARVAIDGWSSIESDKEKKAGTYNWSTFDATTLADLKLTHQYGETIYAAVNVSFSAFTSGTKDTIPAFYADQDITQTDTRTGALNFLTAYVNHVLPAVGSFTLTVDYEVVSNYNLESTKGDDPTCGKKNSTAPWYQCRDSRANTWAAWFSDASAAIRAAAAAYNQAHGTNYVVQVQPIVNGNVIDPTNAVNTGSKAWIPVMVAASDAIAMDNYHCVDGQPVTDADGEIEAIEQWNSLIGTTTKRIVVAENGFSSGLKNGGGLCTESNDPQGNQGKFKGSQAEQAAYYGDLKTKLFTAAQTGVLHGRLQSFNMWSIIDNPLLQSVADTNSDYSFGVVLQPTTYGALGAAKSATSTVQGLVKAFESDATLTPTTQVSSADWTKTLQTGAPISFNAGADHSFLRYTGKLFGTTQACSVSVTLASAQADDQLMLHVDGNDWLITPIAASASPTTIAVPLSAAQCSGEGTHAFTIDIYVTGDVFPVKRVVTGITTAKTPS